MASTPDSSDKKGKGRATLMGAHRDDCDNDDERAPLIVDGFTSNTATTRARSRSRGRGLAEYHTIKSTTGSRTHPSSPRPHPLRFHLITFLIVLFTILLSAGLFLAVLIYSFVPTEREQREAMEKGVIWKGPDRIDVINISDAGIWVQIEGRLALDTDRFLGIHRQPLGIVGSGEEVDKDENGVGYRRPGPRWWENLRASFGDTFLSSLGDLQITIPSHIDLYAHDSANPDKPLITAQIPDPLILPLTSGANLTRIVSLVQLDPIENPGRLLELAKKAWEKGRVEVEVRVGEVHVKTVKVGGWRNWLTGSKKDLALQTEFQLPELPGIPRDFNLSDLIHLESYSFQSTAQSSLGVTAMATLVNPLRDLDMHFPYRLPFEILLPVSSNITGNVNSDGYIKMAEVFTRPIELKGQKTIRLLIDGNVVSDLESSRNTLSGFIQNYLHGVSNPVLVRGLSHSSKHIHTPNWILSGLPRINATLAFPSPNPPPELIRSVTIENMKISESGGKVLASGMVKVVVQLPKEMQGISVNVTGVRPNILIFDGISSEDDVDPDSGPPYPPKAFGHIQPDEYLISESRIEGDYIVVTAPIDKQPIDVLPGRDSVLSDFVAKIVFKGGALAGIKGKAGVEVHLVGVNGGLVLDELPVSGKVIIGKPRSL